jgi:hypothetical protein
MNVNHSTTPRPDTLTQLIEAEVTAMRSDMTHTFGADVAQRLADRVRQQLLSALATSDADDRPHPSAALLQTLALRMGRTADE